MPTRDEVAVICIAQLTAREDATDELLAELHALMAPTRSEPGCVRYELNQSIENPRVLTFVEKWKDMAAFEEHMTKPYLRNLLENVGPRLVESESVILYREILA